MNQSEPDSLSVVQIHIHGQPAQVRAVKAVLQTALQAAGYSNQPARPELRVIRGGGDRQ